MNRTQRLTLLAASAVSSGLLTACADYQQHRTSAVESRHEHYDSVNSGRTDRRAVRSDHMDARAQARFDSW